MSFTQLSFNTIMSTVSPDMLMETSTGILMEMNLSNATLSHIPMEPQPPRHVFPILKFYCLAVIIPIGILFNLLSCAVFLRSRMQKSTTVLYFFALACADNIVLFGELLLWLNTVNITGLTFMHEIDSMCRFIHFLRYFGRLFSSWLVVTICIERYITVAFPLKSVSSTLKKAQVVITVLALICIVLACPAFFAVGSRKKRTLKCLIKEKYEKAYTHWQGVVMTAGELIIPSIIVIIFTCLIISKLVIARQQRLSTREGQQKGPKQMKDRQPTIALVAVSIAFVTLRTPYVIIYPIYRKYIRSLSSWGKFHLYGAFNIAFILAVLNYAVNFLLYIVTGKTFREEFKRFLLCKKSTLGATWSRTSRSQSVTSQTTSLRRFSNSEVLRIRTQAMEGMNGYHGSQKPPVKYTPVHQDSQL